ncbi:hypothetical protein EXS62_02420 [Candidatus Kaiserbacteria bacterium]|nr:hypothetical protein [Candidatus Kaiserbacteria bacterium]
MPKSVEDFIRVPLDERLERTDGLFVKVAYHNDRPYLVARTKEDIAPEDFGDLPCERPLVMFESAQEGVEKCVWFYTKNILPLIAEDNIDIALLSAARFEADALVCDMASLQNLVAAADKHPIVRTFKKITVIDSSFVGTLQLLQREFPHAERQLILALPETGSLGRAEEVDGVLVYRPGPHTTVHGGGQGELVVTQRLPLPTPIREYKTGIHLS